MNIRSVIGVLLILLGAFLFLNRGGDFGTGTIFAYFWPSMFVLPLGLFFHWMYFAMTERSTAAAGLLVPGGVLLTVGLVCQFSMLFDSWGYTWPGFILAPAIGLFEFYWFGNRNKWLLVPINILVVISILFFAVFSIGSLFSHFAGQPIIAILMILVGAVALIGKKKKV